MRQQPGRLGAVVLVILAVLAGSAAGQSVAAPDRLQNEIERLAQTEGGTVGVGIMDLQTGQTVFVNGDEPFPMASTYKVPIAVQLLTRVDRGELSLDRMVTVEPRHLHPGSGTLTRLLDDPGVILSLRNLMELMLLISDNSATDLVLSMAGGSEAVTRRMQSLGIDGIRVDRPTIRLIADWVGIDTLPPASEWSPELFEELYEGVPEEDREAAAEAFDRDLQDTATPRAMVELLAGLWRGEVLSDSSTALLLDVMRRSTTGAARLHGLLPPDTEVAHKTGTIGGTTNDVGIIQLPEDAGAIVAVVFVKQSDDPVEDRERVIAHIARAAYDYFLFSVPAEAGAAR
jgi:beta-lactamase class A